ATLRLAQPVDGLRRVRLRPQGTQGRRRSETRTADRRERADEERHCRDYGGEPRPKKNALGLSDHAQLPAELQREVQFVVKQARDRSGWSVVRTLRHLEIAPATYYRWPKDAGKNVVPRTSAGSLYEVLPSERKAI